MTEIGIESIAAMVGTLLAIAGAYTTRTRERRKLSNGGYKEYRRAYADNSVKPPMFSVFDERLKTQETATQSLSMRQNSIEAQFALFRKDVDKLTTSSGEIQTSLAKIEGFLEGKFSK